MQRLEHYTLSLNRTGHKEGLTVLTVSHEDDESLIQALSLYKLVWLIENKLYLYDSIILQSRSCRFGYEPWVALRR